MHAAEFLPFGLLIGALARMLARGRARGGWVVSMLVGAVGALAGGFIGRGLVLYRDEGPEGFVTSLLGALVAVVVHQAIVLRAEALRPAPLRTRTSVAPLREAGDESQRNP